MFREAEIRSNIAALEKIRGKIDILLEAINNGADTAAPFLIFLSMEETPGQLKSVASAIGSPEILAMIVMGFVEKMMENPEFARAVFEREEISRLGSQKGGL